MSRKDLGKIPAKVAEQYSAEADELGLSRSAYVRQRIEAGRILFKSSGQIDTQLLRELVDHDDTATFETELNTLDDDLDDELTESILANLSTEAARQLTEEELREAVFGTEKEQLEQIREALKQLREAGKIESLVGDGYIKTND